MFVTKTSNIILPPLSECSHNASSTQSKRALELLRASLTSPYPPSKAPLDFELEVVESAPTPDQVQTILSYLPSSPSVASTFLSSHPSATGSESQNVSAKSLTEIASQNTSALKWPIVVDWTGGRASIGDVDGVKGILDAIQQGKR
ncbi:hypothetical protein SCHPADRAFT_823065 [Schizopora paradoxa]|uniref:Thioredoxin-like protein n=1 Tax=Schizopora paradoxa TaxID=27342 RepID=A0A0H2S4N0_9AGAM|nr:hypothetical protein SCHPADRAFT_823065 [Schizopora paradoxa]